MILGGFSCGPGGIVHICVHYCLRNCVLSSILGVEFTMATTRTTPNARAKGTGKHFAKNQAAPKVVGKSVTKRSANAASNEARVREILVGTKRSSGDLPRALGSRPVQDWGSRFRTTRSSLQLDQSRFGHLLGCSMRSLVNYEKGEARRGRYSCDSSSCSI